MSKSSDGFLSFITWVSVLGIALGVAALTVVTSVVNGFEAELMRVITGMNGHVVLYSRGEPVTDEELIENKIRKIVPELQYVTASFVAELMVSGASGVSGAVLEGVDPETTGFVTEIPKRVISGRLPVKEGEVAIGSVLAEKIGAVEGSEIRLIIPFMDAETDSSPSATPGQPAGQSSGTTPRIFKAHTVGIVKMGMHEYDQKLVFGHLTAVQKMMGRPGAVTLFRMKLSPQADSRVVSDRLSDNFGYPFRAKDWAQLNKNALYAIKLEKVVIAIILSTIVVVAAFNVVSTLMMMIHEKTKEVAILKAMGFRKTQSFGLFCTIGLVMGVTGVCLGVAGGMGLNWVIENTKWIALPAEIYFIGFLPVVARWPEIVFISVMALVVCFLATIMPAWKVSRNRPLEGLRYD